ncbi:MAG: hypothetical protein AAF705_05195 [Bacteroidota bacterium]
MILDEIKYHFSIANDHKVVKLAEQLLKDEQNQDNYELLLYKAHAHRNLYQDQMAIEIFGQIIEMRPQEVSPRLNQALCLIDIGEFLKARSTLNIALQLEPQNLEVIHNLIFVEIQIHDFEKAIELAKIGIEIDDTDPILWINLSHAQDCLGNFNEAILSGKKAIDLCKYDAFLLQNAYNNVGYTYTKMSDFYNAKKYLQRATELDQEEPFAWNNLGLVMAKTGQVKEGLQMINRSIKLDRSNSYAYKNRAKVYLMQVKKRRAKADLKKAKELDYELHYGNEVNELLAML